MNRNTLIQSIEVSGTGLHTGADVKMTLQPADAGFGIKFCRTDVDADIKIPADVSNVHSTLRGTNLKKSDIEVKTVEHILSALFALRVTDVLIELDGPEVPIMDGSAQVFVELIQNNISALDETIEVLDIQEPFHFIHESTGAEYYVTPSPGFEITTLIDFKTPHINQQFATLKDLAQYPAEISKCRTFAMASEVEFLMKNDLIKGGSLSNALIFVDVDIHNAKWQDLSKNWGIEELTKNEHGLINGKTMYFENEPARHKLLDLIGDLALLTRPIKAKIIATKPGHTANVELAKDLKKKLLRQRKLKGKPKYDPNIEPIYDINALKDMLPHRYPFLLVDKIIELTDNYVVGVKNVTTNEHFFEGHFPGNPIFPGVLQMEALAQTGGILALAAVENPKEWDTFFLKMDNVKFKHKVVPGDTLIFKMELSAPIRRGLVSMKGTSYVGDKIVSEGDLLAQIIKKQK